MFNQNGLEYYEALQQVLIIDIENYFKEMEPSSRKLLSEVGKILELVLVLPATNATSEQNFSKMGLIKTPICLMSVSITQSYEIKSPP